MPHRNVGHFLFEGDKGICFNSVEKPEQQCGQQE
jgi:hypothetical protein